MDTIESSTGSLLLRSERGRSPVILNNSRPHLAGRHLGDSDVCRGDLIDAAG